MKDNEILVKLRDEREDGIQDCGYILQLGLQYTQCARSCGVHAVAVCTQLQCARSCNVHESRKVFLAAFCNRWGCPTSQARVSGCPVQMCNCKDMQGRNCKEVVQCNTDNNLNIESTQIKNFLFCNLYFFYYIFPV